LLPEFESVNLTEVINFGGRYFQTPKYQEAAKKIGVPFGEIFKKIATNQYLHSCVKPSKNQMDFISFLSENNFNIIGYPTARPKELMEITARSFNYFNFPVAPIIDTQASSTDPSEAKVAFFKKLLADFTINKPILFFDDHVKTAIKLKEEFSGIINPIVPIVPRNKHEIEKLKENNINFGTLQELSKVIGKNYQS